MILPSLSYITPSAKITNAKLINTPIFNIAIVKSTQRGVGCWYCIGYGTNIYLKNTQNKPSKTKPNMSMTNKLSHNTTLSFNESMPRTCFATIHFFFYNVNFFILFVHKHTQNTFIKIKGVY